jgi:hypothetical protein
MLDKPNPSWPQAAFALASVATAFTVLGGTVYLQRDGFPPAKHLIAGPVNGFWIILPLFVAWAYLFSCSLECASRDQRLSGRQRLKQLICSPYTGRRCWPTLPILACCSISIAYGVFSYWYATTDGLTIHWAWPPNAKTYPWSDVTKRFVACIPSKNLRRNSRVNFRVQTRDGQTIELAINQEADFAWNFETISALTSRAYTEFDGDARYCPPFMRGFVERVEETRPK